MYDVDTRDEALDHFSDKVLLISKIALPILLIVLLVFNLFDLLLLLFVGLLIAVFFSGLSDFVSQKSGLSYKKSFFLVCLILLFLTAGSFFLTAPSVMEQYKEFRQSLPVGIDKVREWLEQFGLEQKLREVLQDAERIASKATGILSGVFMAIAHGFILFFMGLYIAYSPSTYKKGLLKLFPIARRKRIEEVFNEVVHTLRWWLIGRFIDMAFIGILIWIGLTILDLPLALILALIAAILNFIPNIGPILGAIPALLIALTQNDPMLVFYVALIFFIVQSLESTITTPLIQQRAIALPPGLTIATQVIAAVTFGTVGLLVATPLLAIVIVLVKRLYVNDVLKDKNT